jgi:hypothetical protein
LHILWYNVPVQYKAGGNKLKYLWHSITFFAAVSLAIAAADCNCGKSATDGCKMLKSRAGTGKSQNHSKSSAAENAARKKS